MGVKAHIGAPQLSDYTNLSLISESDVIAFRQNAIFDETWYLEEYPDVAMSGIDPIRHYLWLGRRLNRYTSRSAFEKAHGLGLRWCIMATPHVLFLAHCIADRIRAHGWSVDIIQDSPASFDHDYYIVLCAQMFKILPPGEKRIIYQLEQSASSRWFSDDYFHAMENSFAVIDYSLDNIEFLSSNGIKYPHVYYIPIGASPSYGHDEVKIDKDIDVLFYGDYKSSPRRQKLLDAVDRRFDLVRIDSLFGDDLKRVVRSAALVLNLHYYENAQLEMPRILECLSLGIPVVSESTKDQRDYDGLEGAVTFFECGNPEAMIAAISSALGNRAAHASSAREAASFWQSRFEFMFDRFLLGTGILPSDVLDKMALEPVSEGSTYALSLPETIDRRRLFDIETRLHDTHVFDGLRRRPGWIGCGMSYKYLCKSALSSGVNQFTIIEDDALLHPNHIAKLEIVNKYLDLNKGQWDIFSGVIAHLHDEVNVLKVERFQGIDFITLNKMTSMIFNTYSDAAIRMIAGWSQGNEHVETNAIDRYLESGGLRVVVTDPYLVGHREEMHSTLWGFQNTEYRDMIAESQDRLTKLKDEWIKCRTSGY